MKTVDNAKYQAQYDPGSLLIRGSWLLVSLIFFRCPVPYPYQLKSALLAMFGAKIGKNIVIKPEVYIKYPWFLTIGDSSWVGEKAWIDNLGKVVIGNNVCISQGAYIATGNHNYKKEAFDLIVKDVTIEDGVWVGAKAIVCPGVTLKTHSVITIGSVITHDTNPYTVYQGNPAAAIRERKID